MFLFIYLSILYKILQNVELILLFYLISNNSRLKTTKKKFFNNTFKINQF